MAVRFSELIVDASDPTGLARWWAEVLGWRVTDDDDEGAEIAPRDGTLPTIVFVPVPEAKAGKNRLHIDVSPVGRPPGSGSPSERELQEEELERLLSLGATPADVGQGDETWVVLADPEGNEFCLLRRPVEAAPTD
jgi:catechol 2,3-dioxygenase-like lactoylglutathione lyase family enzyme